MDLEYIKDLVRSGSFSVSEHAALRKLQRGIFDDEIVGTILGGRAIQEYPNAIPYPRVVFRSYSATASPIEVVCDLDEEYEEVIIVTVERARSRRGRGRGRRS